MVAPDDGSIWPRGYWHTWAPIVGPRYATTLTKLRAWSNVVTTLLYTVAVVLAAYYLLIAKGGSILWATIVLLIPWTVIVAVIEYQRRRVAKTMQRNLAAAGKPVSQVPIFIEVRFLEWKRTHSVTTDDLESSAPR
jgi:hypothetical protein